MLKGIKIISQKHLSETIPDEITYSCLVQDSDFEDTITFVSKCKVPSRVLVDAVALTYHNRSLSIAKNVAALYISLFKQHGERAVRHWITPDANWMDTYYPTIKYKDKHLQCVLRQINQLQFGVQYANMENCKQYVCIN